MSRQDDNIVKCAKRMINKLSSSKYTKLNGEYHSQVQIEIERMKNHCADSHNKLSDRDLNVWISVNDRIPDVDFEVLVCCDDDVFIDVMRSGCVDGDFWFDCERDHGRKVTHWMQLPEPPK